MYNLALNLIVENKSETSLYQISEPGRLLPHDCTEAAIRGIL